MSRDDLLRTIKAHVDWLALAEEADERLTVIRRMGAIACPISPIVGVVGTGRIVIGRSGAEGTIRTAGGCGPYAALRRGALRARHLHGRVGRTGPSE